MRKLLLLIILIFQQNQCQNYINIGSTKEQVKKLQGEPTSIEIYDEIGKEIWRYGEYGIASITFKNSKIKEFKNHNHILRIGDNSEKKKSSEKITSQDTFWKKARDSNDIYPPSPADAYGEDKSGLYGSATQDIKRFPKEYEEMAESNGLNPYAMPDEYALQEMQKEYDREKYLKWGLIFFATLGMLYLVFKLNKRKK
ncbi:hypothetical protein [Epilithonimonas xixisoli]|uniref:Uncharacterized protein n=1 Tax=Epilithonimonas xixisoli TaxID=1476462 RepID=A0A4R8IB88_9FLAO|nr:hypothetical protein [Epilithonimonas xixisoli]TDX84601.1 hypothetical protein B0I22_2230 [Epilithonimonas xixisoli]